jgi:cellulose biosynthesis protein BcsQ
LTKTISFHSYKGGTGKSLISLNIAVNLAQKGKKVVLLDFDFLGPSLFGVFGEPSVYLNEVIFGKFDIMNALLEYTQSKKITGKLFYGLANPEPAVINNIYQLDSTAVKRSFERTMDVKEILEDELKADYLIIDTGPSMRMDSANAIVISDHVSLVLKPTKADVIGTTNL